LLFSGLLIRLEIGLAVISFAANGHKVSFPDSPESHCSWVSGGRMTGIRLWIWATNSFGSPVMITQVRSHSFVCPDFASHPRGPRKRQGSRLSSRWNKEFSPRAFSYITKSRRQALSIDACEKGGERPGAYRSFLLGR
jgi:hypothetical protein